MQYRGVFWSQQNGKDWTVSAFLQSEKGGLDLRLARDAGDGGRDPPGPGEAGRRAARRPAGQVGQPANSNGHDFDALVSDDPVDDLLTWLADPKGVRARWESRAAGRRCAAGARPNTASTPRRTANSSAPRMLGLHAKPAWKTAWKRFAAAPARYAGLVDLLRKAKPKPKGGDLFGKLAVESWPQDNEAEEAEPPASPATT